jgi:hypothetical protein
MEALTSTQSFILYAIGIVIILFSIIKLNKLGLDHGSLEFKLKLIAQNRVHTDRKGFKSAKDELAHQRKVLLFWVLVILACVAEIIATWHYS